MRSSIWKKGLICLSAVMLLECPVGALPGTAYTAKAEETDDKTDTSNIKSILLIVFMDFRPCQNKFQLTAG